MSTAVILFSIYFAIGLVALIVAVAAPGSRARTKGSEAFGGGDALEAGVLICAALFWPIWALYALLKPERKYMDEGDGKGGRK